MNSFESDTTQPNGITHTPSVKSTESCPDHPKLSKWERFGGANGPALLSVALRFRTRE
uniref:Uncharacterized protein n=1 Tax=Anguilla anguilla TaxID=7936 RepID=A0A0E9PUW9_ANGAN